MGTQYTMDEIQFRIVELATDAIVALVFLNVQMSKRNDITSIFGQQ